MINIFQNPEVINEPLKDNLFAEKNIKSQSSSLTLMKYE